MDDWIIILVSCLWLLTKLYSTPLVTVLSYYLRICLLFAMGHFYLLQLIVSFYFFFLLLPTYLSLVTFCFCYSINLFIVSHGLFMLLQTYLLFPIGHFSYSYLFIIWIESFL